MKKTIQFIALYFVIFCAGAQDNRYSFIKEDYEIPANGIYHTWDSSKTYTQELTIPFDENGHLKVILVEDNSPFQTPCDYQNVVSSFSKNNTGVDLKVSANSEVRCCFDGVVRAAGEFPSIGKLIIVRHYNGLETVYSHLESIAVKPNQKVTAGQRLGTIGKMGGSTQLHFEVRFMNAAINPAHLIDFATKELRSNVLVIRSEEISSSLEITSTTLPTNGNTRFYVVQPGDTLSKIAQDHHVSVEKLYRWNNLTEHSILQLGQKIRVSE